MHVSFVLFPSIFVSRKFGTLTLTMRYKQKNSHCTKHKTKGQFVTCTPMSICSLKI